MVNTFANLRTNQQLGQQLLTPVSNVSAAHSTIIQGYTALEQATASKPGDANTLTNLLQAERALNRALDNDPQNAWAQMFLASCYFNRTNGALATGDDASAVDFRRKYRSSLKKAYQHRSGLTPGHRADTAADYALLYKTHAVKEAISEYKKLIVATATDHNDPIMAHLALRGALDVGRNLQR